jgi:hypothetical protein
MITGSCPGAGKSSLARDLAGVFGSRGVSVLTISEDDVWGKRELGLDPVSHASALPEFSAVIHDQRTSPSSSAILRIFAQVRARYLEDQAMWIQDWSWLDLASRLMGERRQGDALTGFARNLLQAARDLNPVVLFLRLDPTLGLERAVHERGGTWLRRHAGVPVATPAREDDLVRGLVDHYRAHAREQLKMSASSGWETRIIDADVERPEVLSAAIAALGLDST